MNDSKLLSSFDRRKILQGAGLASGTLFLPSLLGDKAAHAQGMPKRLVVFATDHGPVMGRWEFRPPGLAGTPQGEWEVPLGPMAPADFSESLRPLHGYRDDVLILEGLAMTNMLADKGGNNHDLATGARQTGAMQSDAKRVSFDQYIADQNAVPGRFKYLAFTPHAGDKDNAGFFDTAGNRVVLARVDNTYGFLGSQYSRVFDGVSSTPAPTPTGPLAGVDLSRARRQSSVEFVRAQYQKVAARLGGEDKAKLSLHRDMLQDLALRVTALSQLKCEKPAYPPKGNESRTEIANIVVGNLFPVAMACDLTRVGLIHQEQLTNAEIGAGPGDVHDIAAHASWDNPNGPPGNWMVNYHAIHAGQFAKMIAAYKSVPEGNGTMLDNTVLIWQTELATGGHDLYRMMYVMAGGKNLGFRTGRYLKYAETQPNPATGGSNTRSSSWAGIGPAHSKLFVSLMKAFGVNRDSIGLASAKGALYMSGAPVTLSGPLPRLT